VLVELIPGLPIEDEEQLRDAGVRERFLEHVRSYAGLRAQASGPRR
jgi:hypothetical protein